LEVPYGSSRRLIEEHHVFQRGLDSPEYPQDELQVNRLPEMTGLDHVSHVVDHAHVVDLDLGFGPALPEETAELPEGLEGVGKDEVLGHADILRFPGKLPLLVP